MLALIPQLVNGKQLSMNYLEDLLKKPKAGKPVELFYHSDALRKDFGPSHVMRSYWILHTKDVLPGTFNHTYENQVQLLKNTIIATQMPYDVPKIMETSIVILLEFFKAGKEIYDRYSTRCRERGSLQPTWPFNVGHFSANKHSLSDACLEISYLDAPHASWGLAGVRRL